MNQVNSKPQHPKHGHPQKKMEALTIMKVMGNQCTISINELKRIFGDASLSHEREKAIRDANKPLELFIENSRLYYTWIYKVYNSIAECHTMDQLVEWGIEHVIFGAKNSDFNKYFTFNGFYLKRQLVEGSKYSQFILRFMMGERQPEIQNKGKKRITVTPKGASVTDISYYHQFAPQPDPGDDVDEEKRLVETVSFIDLNGAGPSA